MQFTKEQLTTVLTDYAQYTQALYDKMERRQPTGMTTGLPDWIAGCRMTNEEFIQWSLALFLRFRAMNLNRKDGVL